ncbi:MAG: hypothetical protein A3K19_14510 [Lentisphaerae bacterium RIFOXYB12_FULL_65_16]|nr:MAG: hypothetical protein A3K18_18555 [Lentisphaerae bacterium RIFOXYA12_64_32]OGV87435.1 MAG: hypothetical protein A3K19_14510 [Lentisphaerae bacterium RIFOXYB12_FULL_65_16]
MFSKRLTIGCLAALALGVFVCRTVAGDSHGHEHGHEHGHTAAHGGCLNALGACENGHAEVKLAGDVLDVWFVGGGADTAKAVRIPDPEIALAVTLAGASDAKTLTLKARPNELAEERVGDCAHFVGQADWLKDAKAFKATGSVTFKGRTQQVRIEYPRGYDPDDDAAHEHPDAAGEHQDKKVDSGKKVEPRD